MENGDLQVLRFLVNADEIWKARNQLLLGELDELNLLQVTSTSLCRSHTYASTMKIDIDHSGIQSSDTLLLFNYIIITFDGSFQKSTMLKGGWSFLVYDANGFLIYSQSWLYFRLRTCGTTRSYPQAPTLFPRFPLASLLFCKP